MHIDHKFFSRLFLLSALMISVNSLSAQPAAGDTNVYMIGILIVIGALILVSAILTLSQNFISIEAAKSGVDIEEEDNGFSLTNLWKEPNPIYTQGAPVTELKKGHDILLKGKPAKEISQKSIKRFAVNPQSFRGLSPIPKVLVEVGDEVKAGVR